MNAPSTFLGLLIVLFIILVAPLDAQGEVAGHRVRITKDVSELRIDHISTESPLLGVWRGQRLEGQQALKNSKFVVKVNRGGTRTEENIYRYESDSGFSAEIMVDDLGPEHLSRWLAACRRFVEIK